MSARAFAVFMAVLALVGLLAYGLISRGEETLAAGDPVPATELDVLGGSGTGSIADHEGRWVLLNVWASWCKPCEEESPALQRYHDLHAGKRFTILGIDSQDNTDDALAFVERFGLSYPQLHDGSGEFAQEELGTTGVPESFLVDPGGRVAAHFAGPLTIEHLEGCVTPSVAAGRTDLAGCQFPGVAR